MKKYIPKFGDVLFYRSYGFIPKLIRLLIAIRYGLPLKYAWSHVAMVIDGERAVSAEASGVEIVKWKEDPTLKKSDITAFRFNKPINIKSKKAMYEAIEALVGKGYGYARYALDFLRVMVFYLIVLGTVPAVIFYKKVWPFYVGGLILFVIIEKLLKKVDSKSYDCVESVSVILTHGGLWRAVGFKSRSEFPDGMRQVFKNLELHGVVSTVYEKRAGEDL